MAAPRHVGIRDRPPAAIMEHDQVCEVPHPPEEDAGTVAHGEAPCRPVVDSRPVDAGGYDFCIGRGAGLQRRRAPVPDATPRARRPRWPVPPTAARRDWQQSRGPFSNPAPDRRRYEVPLAEYRAFASAPGRGPAGRRTGRAASGANDRLKGSPLPLANAPTEEGPSQERRTIAMAVGLAVLVLAPLADTTPAHQQCTPTPRAVCYSHIRPRTATCRSATASSHTEALAGTRRPLAPAGRWVGFASWRHS